MPGIFGPDAQDISAQQRTVGALMVAIAHSLDAHKGEFGAGVIEQWNVLAHDAMMFAGEEPGFALLERQRQYEHGRTLLAQLSAWDGSLRAMGIVPQVAQRQVPAPPPGPSERTFLGNLFDHPMQGVVLLLLLAVALGRR